VTRAIGLPCSFDMMTFCLDTLKISGPNFHITLSDNLTKNWTAKSPRISKMNLFKTYSNHSNNRKIFWWCNNENCIDICGLKKRDEFLNHRHQQTKISNIVLAYYFENWLHVLWRPYVDWTFHSKFALFWNN